eukprot:COSAG05_NODE_9568_length_615_cov_1.143411_1_plen_79_part_00
MPIIGLINVDTGTVANIVSWCVAVARAVDASGTRHGVIHTEDIVTLKSGTVLGPALAQQAIAFSTVVISDVTPHVDAR